MTHNAKHILGKTAKIIGYILGGVLLLFLVVWIALQFPPVQTFVAQKATGYLSKKLNTEVAIEEVDIKFFKTIVLKGIYVEDLKGDTLIYAGRLEANIGVFALSQQRITLNLIGLENAVVNFTKAKGDKEYNYEFIPKAFASDTTAKKDTTAGWEFDLEEADFKNVRFNVDDAVAENKLHVKVKGLEADLKTLGLQSKHIQANNIRVDQLSFDFQTRAAKDTAFIADSLPKKIEELGTKEVLKPLNPSGYAFTMDNFEVRNSEVRYLVVNAPVAQKGMMDYKNLHIQHLNIDIEDVEVGVNNLTGEVKQFGFIEKNSGFMLSELALAVQLDMPRLHLTLEDFRTPHSEMNNGVEIHLPSVKNLKNITAELEADIEWDRDSIAIRDIEYFASLPKEYKALKNKKIYLHGDISARNGVYALNDLDIGVDRQNYLVGDITVRGFYRGFYKDKNAFTNLYADVNISELKANMAFISSLLPPGTLPAEMRNLGNVVATIDVQGKVQDMEGDVNVRTAHGQLASDFHLRTDQNFDRKDIVAHVTTNNLNLEKFLGKQSKLGKVTMQADIDATQSSRMLEVRKADALVNSVVYNAYRYTNLRASGNYINKVGKAEVVYNDANLKLDLNALADMNGAQPDFKIDGIVGKADLRKLNFSKDTLVVATVIAADVSGKTPDAMVGVVSLRNTTVTKGMRTLPLDSLRLVTTLDSGYRHIELSSDMMNAVVHGKFTFTGIGVAMQQYISRYISTMQAPATAGVADQSFTFNVYVKQNPRLLQLLVSGLQVPKPVTLQGNFDSKGNVLNFTGDAPDLRFNTTRISGLALRGITENDRLNVQTTANQIALSDTLVISKPVVSARLDRDLVNFGIDAALPRQESSVDLNGNLAFRGDTLLLTFDPSALVIKGLPFKVSDNGRVAYTANYLTVKDVELRQGNQLIALNTSPLPGRKVMLRVDIANLIIGPLMEVVPANLPYRLDGMINGNAQVYNLFDIERIESDLKVSNFAVDKSIIGDVGLIAQQNAKTGLLDVGLTVRGQQNDIVVDGTYDTAADANGNVMNFNVAINQINTAQFMPFVKESVSRMEGIIMASLTVRGAPSQPVVTGKVNFGENTIVQPKILQIPFNLGNQTLALNASRVDFNRFVVLDDLRNPLTLNGYFDFSNLNRMAMDLKMDARQFHLMNSGYNDNSTFYGKAYMTTDLRVQGLVTNLTASGSIRTEAGTDIYLPIGGQEREVKRADYISFVGDSLAAPVAPKKKAASPSGFALNAKVTVTRDARFTVIIDPNTGDELQCRGDAVLRVRMSPEGDINLQGTYEIAEGHYAMNLFGMVKRRLEIQKGSSIYWTGLPTDAVMNITTTYKTKASRYELIADQSGFISKAEERVAKIKLPVYVDVKMKGTLLRPDLSFDIRIPEAEQSFNSQGETSLVTARLNQIKANQSELLKQVFGLIAFNRFINDGGLMAGGSGGGTNESINNAVDESLSDLLTKQLNNISGEYLGGLEFTVSMESNNSNSSAEQALTSKNVAVGLSRGFFNDRMKVTVGSNFNTGSSSSSNENTRLNTPNRLIGDVIVEYRLNASGNVNLKFFRTYNQNLYDINASMQRTGASLTHHRDFNSVRELFFRKKRPRVNKDARREEEVTAGQTPE